MISLVGLGWSLFGQESDGAETGAQSRATVLKLMPLGDSITQGAVGRASYRYWLFQLLRQASIEVDFVGSQSQNHQGSNLFNDFDQDHEGHWGWRSDQILAQIDTWARAARPDMVLIHLGTNDVFYNRDEASIIAYLSAIVDSLRVVNPRVTIIVAQLIPALLYDHIIFRLNKKIVDLVASKSTNSSKLMVVDQYNDINLLSDVYDGVHPNQSGEQKIAKKWFEAIQNVLQASAGQSSK